MKTEFFLTNTLNEEEKKQFKDLFTSNDVLFDEIYNWFNNQTSFPSINSELTKLFSEKTGEKPEKINNIIIGIYNLIQIFRKSTNKVSDFIDDFTSTYSELISDYDIVSKRLNSISNISKKYDLFFKIQETLNSGISSLKTASVSVAPKPVINERFDIKDDIKNYKPQILQYEACVLFEMIRDDNEKLSFQMSPENFEKFINHMISIQIELKTVSDGIGK